MESLTFLPRSHLNAALFDENMFTNQRDKKTPNLFKVLNHPELCLLFFYFLQKQYW